MRATTPFRYPILAAAAVAALLGGCSSGAAPAAAPTSPSVSAAAPTTAAAVAPTPGLSCADLAATATTLTTGIHYIALNVGTTNDSATYYPAIDQALVDLDALAPECAPKATAAVTELATAVDTLQEGLQPGAEAAAIEADAALLDEVRAVGISAYRALGVPVVGWQNRPENRVAG